MVQDDNSDKYGYIDKSNNVVIPCVWKNAYSFGATIEGLAEVMNENNLWGFIDKTGKVVLPCQWKEIGVLQEFDDLYSVKDANGYWGYIDRTGKVVIPYKYLSVWGTDIPNRAKAKKKDESEVLIDRNGKEYPY